MLDLNEVEILQVALASEERARTFYERQAARHGGTPAGDLFTFLAGEEAGHIRKLSAAYGIPAFEAGWEAKYLPYLLDLDRLVREEGLESDSGAAPGAVSPDEAVRKGLAVAGEAERHAVSFYEAAAGVVEDRDTKDLLLRLKDEERTHLARIEGYRNDLRE
jgi:rubrerythrin